MKIILASGSPRRRELINRITNEYEVFTASVDEEKIESALASGSSDNKIDLAEKTVRALSRAKAIAAFEALGCPEDTVVIGADTVVAVSSEILGKPKDRDDAVRMLRKESLEPQTVMTGVSFAAKKAFNRSCCSGCCGCADSVDKCGSCCSSCKSTSVDSSDVLVRTFTEKSTVFFHILDDAQEERIQAYCNTSEPYDKAGAYGIQEKGGALVERYDGDFDNIVGFPVSRIKQELSEFIL